AVLPLFSINVAHNKVKIPGLVTLVMGIFFVIFAIMLSGIPELGYYGVAIAGVIVLTLKNGVFIPWYSSHILHIPVSIFIKSIIPGIIGTIGIALSSAILLLFFNEHLLLELISVGTIISILYILLVWKLCLDKFEYNLLKSYLPK